MLIRPRFIDPDDFIPKLRFLDPLDKIDLTGEVNSEIVSENTFDYKNIKSLYHFTPIKNIPNILRFGLLSRDQCEKWENMVFYNLCSIFTDPNRYDRRKDYISCSINKPFWGMLQRKRMRKKDFGGIAILKIKKEILFDAKMILYCSGYSSLEINANKSDDELQCYENILDQDDHFLIDSEILVKDHIPLYYVDSVYFNTKDWNWFLWALDVKCRMLNFNINFTTNNNLFKKGYMEE
jgi:hypothetical protein